MKKFFSIILLLFVSTVLSFAAGIPVAPIAGAIGVGTLALPHIPGIVRMAITPEIWTNDIVGNIFRTNPFLDRAVNHDSYVLAGKVVHIPNAGVKPTVVKNRTSLPASVTRRDDLDINYTLDEFTSDPILITDAETVELSYDKKASVMGETEAALAETIGDEILYKWAPSVAAQFVRTSGSTAVVAHTDGATGNRKALTVADLAAAKLILNKQGAPAQGRVAVIDSDMMKQLTDNLTATQYRDFSASYDEKNGIIGRLEGFDLLDRGYVLRYTNDTLPVLKTPDAAAATDDNAAALCWHPLMVARALGDTKFFEDMGNPQYFGDLYSALIRMGGRKMRNDQKGVVAIIQTATT